MPLLGLLIFKALSLALQTTPGLFYVIPKGRFTFCVNPAVLQHRRAECTLHPRLLPEAASGLLEGLFWCVPGADHYPPFQAYRDSLADVSSIARALTESY